MKIMDRHDGMNKCRFEMWLTDDDLKKLKKYKEKCKKKWNNDISEDKALELILLQYRDTE